MCGRPVARSSTHSMCPTECRYVFDVVRAVVPKIDLDNVFIAKEEIAQDVQATLTKARWVAPLCVWCLWLQSVFTCSWRHSTTLGGPL